MSGLFCIIIGAIIGLFNFFKYLGDDSAIRQTVQYLGYLIATTLIVGGLILMKLSKFINEKRASPKNNKTNFSNEFEIREESKSPEDFEIQNVDNKIFAKKKNGYVLDFYCPHCYSLISSNNYICLKCGKSLLANHMNK